MLSDKLFQILKDDAVKVLHSICQQIWTRYWMLGAGALGRPRGMEWGERREEGSGWGTHVCFCIHSASLCLLVGAFNPFTFKVITDKYDPVAIYFIVLGSILYTIFVFPV